MFKIQLAVSRIIFKDQMLSLTAQLTLKASSSEMYPMSVHALGCIDCMC